MLATVAYHWNQRRLPLERLRPRRAPDMPNISAAWHHRPTSACMVSCSHRAHAGTDRTLVIGGNNSTDDLRTNVLSFHRQLLRCPPCPCGTSVEIPERSYSFVIDGLESEGLKPAEEERLHARQLALAERGWRLRPAAVNHSVPSGVFDPHRPTGGLKTSSFLASLEGLFLPCPGHNWGPSAVVQYPKATKRGRLSVLAETIGAIVVLTIVRGLLDRVTNRFAVWVLPDNQAITFRAAWLLLLLAEHVAPESVLEFRSGWWQHLGSDAVSNVYPCYYSVAERARQRRARFTAALHESTRVSRPLREAAATAPEASCLRLRYCLLPWRLAGGFVAFILYVVLLGSVSAWSARLRTRPSPTPPKFRGP